MKDQDGVSRRRFMTASGAGVALGLLSACGASGSKATEVKVTPRPVFGPEAASEEIITVEKAKEMVGEVAKFYAKSGFSDFSAEELVGRTFFVSEKADPSSERDLERLYNGENVSDNSTIREFIQDYPHISYSPWYAQKILELKHLKKQGIDTGFSVFVNLETVNKYGRENGPIPLTYSGNTLPVTCSDPSSFAVFEDTLIHEWTHNEASYRRINRETNILQGVPLSSRFENAIRQRFHEWKPLERYLSVENIGFDTHAIMTPEGIFRGVFNFEEYSTLYIGLRLFQKFQRPATPGYQEDMQMDEYLNFATILRQSDITDEEFVTLHTESNLSQFVDRVVASAKKIPNESEDTQYQTIVNSLVAFERLIDWQTLQKYFPGINLTDYDFSLNNSPKKGMVPGCGRS